MRTSVYFEDQVGVSENSGAGNPGVRVLSNFALSHLPVFSILRFQQRKAHPMDRVRLQDSFEKKP